MEDEEEEKESIHLGYKLQDLSDVQVIARRQEESRYPCTPCGSFQS